MSSLKRGPRVVVVATTAAVVLRLVAGPFRVRRTTRASRAKM